MHGKIFMKCKLVSLSERCFVGSRNSGSYNISLVRLEIASINGKKDAMSLVTIFSTCGMLLRL